jgi:hypothetical protein
VRRGAEFYPEREAQINYNATPAGILKKHNQELPVLHPLN